MEKSVFRNESQNSDFRNNSKCFFNDSGFCKFGDECRKQHYKNVCSSQFCDKTCNSRHPKLCKFNERCKFNAKEICAYKHVTPANDEVAVEALKKQVQSLKLENEKNVSKVKRLEE